MNVMDKFVNWTGHSIEPSSNIILFLDKMEQRSIEHSPPLSDRRVWCEPTAQKMVSRGLILRST